MNNQPAEQEVAEAMSRAKGTRFSPRWEADDAKILFHALGVLSRALTQSRERVGELEQSMVKHFQRDHLSGDGPEIDRWKLTIKEERAKSAALAERVKAEHDEIEALRKERDSWKIAAETHAGWAKVVKDLKAQISALSEALRVAREALLKWDNWFCSQSCHKRDGISEQHPLAIGRHALSPAPSAKGGA